MAISVVQAPNLTFGPFTASVKTFTGLTALTVDDYVVAAVANDQNRTFSSVTLGGQPMTAFPNNPIDQSFADLGLWYRKVTGTESGQDVVATLNAGDGNNAPMGAIVIRGLNPTVGVTGDVENSSVSGLVHDILSPTPTFADNIVIAFSFRGNRNWTTNGGWTDVGTLDNRYSFAYAIQSSIATKLYEITADAASTAIFAIGTLDGAPSGSSSVSPSLSPSASQSPSASTSPSSSSSASVSPSASQSPSSSPSPSIAPQDAIAWGEQTPGVGEEAVTWKRWQTEPGVPISVSGDQDWGSARVQTGVPAVGPVSDTGDSSSKTFTAQVNKYATGSGAVVLQIRGSLSPFGMHDTETVGPTWATYSTPVVQSWRYVQLRILRTV